MTTLFLQSAGFSLTRPLQGNVVSLARFAGRSIHFARPRRPACTKLACQPYWLQDDPLPPDFMLSALRTMVSIKAQDLPPEEAVNALHRAVPRSRALSEYAYSESGQRVDRRQLRIPEQGADMDIIFLGTASSIPSSHRGVSCTALRFGAEAWLFDAGEGSQIQIQKSLVRPSKVKRLFVTHLHGDHVWGVPGMLCLIGRDREAERSDEGVVEIYGPEGLRQFVRTAIEITYSKAAPVFRVHELKATNGKKFQRSSVAKADGPRTYNELEGTDIYPDRNGVYSIFDSDTISVAAAQIKHTVPCFGYVVREYDRPGTLKADKVAQIIEANREELTKIYGAPMKVNRDIKAMKPDETFTFPDGTTVSYDDVMDAPHRGRKVVILGDTSDPSNISELAQGADVLVHEATNAYIPELDENTSAREVEQDARRHGHSTPQMAGRFARDIGARKLLLNHFSSRYRGDQHPDSLRIMERIEDLARRAMGSTAKEDVIAAWDSARIPLPVNKPPKA